MLSGEYPIFSVIFVLIKIILVMVQFFPPTISINALNSRLIRAVFNRVS